MDESDLNRKQWDWQTSGSKKTVLKQWPDEHLPMAMTSRPFGTKLDTFPDQYSRRIDYEN